MISEGSCDTEDWSNDAENTALCHKNKLHFTIYYNRNLWKPVKKNSKVIQNKKVIVQVYLAILTFFSEF